MASSSNPSQPTNPAHVIASIPILRFDLLDSWDNQEYLSLRRACCTEGFFHLDLRGSQYTHKLLTIVDELLRVTPQGAYRDSGYSTTKVHITSSRPKPAEQNVSRRTGQGISPGEAPALADSAALRPTQDAALEEPKAAVSTPVTNAASEPQGTAASGPDEAKRRQMLISFWKAAHALLRRFLCMIDVAIKLPFGTLEKLHPLRDVRGLCVDIAQAPNVLHRLGHQNQGFPHTDLSTLTILFTYPGIIPMAIATDNTHRRLIRGRPGCALISLGDVLKRLTGGAVRSSSHCTSGHHLAYVLRPEDDLVLKRLVGGDIIPKVKEDKVEDEPTYKEWVEAHYPP